MRETITIPKTEYEYLKSQDKKVDWKVVESFRKGLKDLKKGKVIPIEKSTLFN